MYVDIYPFVGGIGTSTVTLLTAVDLAVANERKVNVHLADVYEVPVWDARCGLINNDDWNEFRSLEHIPNFSYGPRILNSGYLEFTLHTRNAQFSRPHSEDTERVRIAFLNNSYNALRLFTQSPVSFDGVVLWMNEDGALGVEDVRSVIRPVPIITTNKWDPGVRRRDDAGMLVGPYRRELPTVKYAVGSLYEFIINQLTGAEV